MEGCSLAFASPPLSLGSGCTTCSRIGSVPPPEPTNGPTFGRWSLASKRRGSSNLLAGEGEGEGEGSGWVDPKWMEGVFGKKGNAEGGGGGAQAGKGLIDIRLSGLKKGGFKLFFFLAMMSMAKAPDNKVPFSVDQGDDGVRLLLTDTTTEDPSTYNGVLDLSWKEPGDKEDGYLRVDRINLEEKSAYPGEVYVLKSILSALEEINDEERPNEERLFVLKSSDELVKARKRLDDRRS